MFESIMIGKDDTNGYRASLQNLDDAQLLVGDVTVQILHSTINYKDVLAITCKRPVVRKFPSVSGPYMHRN